MSFQSFFANLFSTQSTSGNSNFSNQMNNSNTFSNHSNTYNNYPQQRMYGNAAPLEEQVEEQVEEQLPKGNVDEPIMIMLLDASGSMQDIYKATLESINAFVHEQVQDEPGNATPFTLVTFDTTSKTVINDVPVSEVTKITEKEYRLGGSTALLDALGRILERYKEFKLVSLVIVTDGQENASRKFNRQQIKQGLEEAQKKGWIVNYLGADQDSFAEGKTIGLAASQCANWDKSAQGVMMANCSMAQEVKSRVYFQKNSK